MSDGTDADATIEKSRRSIVKRLRRQPGAPIARAPIGHERHANDSGSSEPPVDLMTSVMRETALAGPLMDDGAELGTPGGRRSRAYPDAPEQISPARPERALKVVDGDADEDVEVDTG
ncbi:MAG: hypothetical protein ACSLFF_02915, partial [Solirubrobacterales bacterium]